MVVTRARLPHSRPTLGAEGPDARGNRAAACGRGGCGRGKRGL